MDLNNVQKKLALEHTISNLEFALESGTEDFEYPSWNKREGALISFSTARNALKIIKDKEMTTLYSPMGVQMKSSVEEIEQSYEAFRRVLIAKLTFNLLKKEPIHLVREGVVYKWLEKGCVAPREGLGISIELLSLEELIQVAKDVRMKGLYYG